ncbi:MAG: hypothetical protein HZB16_19600 [Armatimonadetes bacterium]|nr:hypothetical protein [Armatimonadota bacterium]
MKLTRILLALLVVVRVQAAPPATMDAKEIQPGMTGYGLTVFHGTTIEKFNVEVIGVLPFADLDDDWIMMRITSGPVAERGSGVVGGMSGSPVFIGERLVGAVAFGYPMPRESVCFVQPIGQMMRALKFAEAPEQLAEGEVRPLERPMTVMGRTVDRVRVGSGTAAQGELVAEPMATPLAVSGLGEAGLERLGRAMAPYRLALQAAPAGRASGTVDMQPGAAVGVLLVDGDVRAAGTGTLTWRDGDRMLAFGHPMLQRGRVKMPLCGASIIDFFNGIQRSDKISVALDPCGTLEADTRWAIAGRLGAAPSMVPVHLSISDPQAGFQRQWRFSVIDDRTLGPALAFNLLGSLVDGTCGEWTKVGYEAHSVVKFAGREPLDRRRNGFVASGGSMATLAEVMSAVQIAVTAPYDDLRLEGLDLTIDVTHGDRTATMVRARFDTQQVKPGESMKLDLDLRRRADGSIRPVSMTVPIPANTPPGRYRMAVSGGAQAPALDQQLGTLPLPATSTDQLFRRIAERPADDLSLVAKLAAGSFDVGIRGRRLPGPPAHLEQLLTRGLTTDLTRARAALTTRLPLDLLVTNALTAEITVLDPLTGEAPRPVTSDGPSPDGGGGDASPSRGPAGTPVSTFVTELAQPSPDDPLAPWLASPCWLRALWGQPVSYDLATGPLPKAVPTADPATPDAKSTAGHGDTKPDTTKPPEPTPAPAPAAARAPKAWLLSSARDFAPGDTDGVALDPQGTLQLAAGHAEVARWAEPHLFAADTDRAGVTWLGGGTTGELLKLTGDKLEVAWHGDDPLVTAVCATTNGVLFATAPSGIIRRVDAQGKVTDVVDLDAAYVWQLRAARDGSVLAVTGRPSRLLRLRGDTVTELASFELEHALCLAEAPNGVLYAAGGMPGRVLRVDGASTSVVATATDAVTALAVGSDNTVYFGHGGTLSALGANGDRRQLSSFAGWRVLAILPTARGLLVSTGLRNDGRSALFSVNRATGDATAVFDEKLAAITALVPQTDGTFLAAGDAPARVYRLTLPCGANGSYLSPVLDAGARARWGTFEVGLAEGSAGTVAVEARSGDTPRPTDDWTPWLPVNGKPVCGPARYWQYRLLLAAGDGRSPLVESTRLDYALVNTEPKVTIESPLPGSAWKGKQDVRWKVTDAENDPTVANVYIKSDGSGEWRQLAEGLAPGTTTFSLDPVSAKVADGRYRVRVIVDDLPMNPTDPRQGSAVSEALWIDNTPPTVLLPEQLVSGDALDFRINVSDNCRLASVEVRADGRPWRAAAPVDGLIDSALEMVQVTYRPIPAGKHTLEIRARDQAGNETVVKRDLVK